VSIKADKGIASQSKKSRDARAVESTSILSPPAPDMLQITLAEEWPTNIAPVSNVGFREGEQTKID
jgi:hypothetical protein